MLFPGQRDATCLGYQWMYDLSSSHAIQIRVHVNFSISFGDLAGPPIPCCRSLLCPINYTDLTKAVAPFKQKILTTAFLKLIKAFHKCVTK